MIVTAQRETLIKWSAPHAATRSAASHISWPYRSERLFEQIDDALSIRLSGRARDFFSILKHDECTLSIYSQKALCKRVVIVVCTNYSDRFQRGIVRKFFENRFLRTARRAPRRVEINDDGLALGKQFLKRRLVEILICNRSAIKEQGDRSNHPNTENVADAHIEKGHANGPGKLTHSSIRIRHAVGYTSMQVFLACGTFLRTALLKEFSGWNSLRQALFSALSDQSIQG